MLFIVICILAGSLGLKAAALPAGPCGAIVQESPLDEFIAAHIEDWLAFYRDLHTHPELSLHEERTAARLARTWRDAGLEVAEGVGGHGIVGILHNGAGPCLMLRTDMDALPLAEETGLSYASRVTTTLEDRPVGVMHACGHDVHMTVMTGVVQALTALRRTWHGTLMVIGQPAEERGMGARMMLEDGLFDRFARPDFALAMHVDATLPAGHIGYTIGGAMANVDSVDITIFGKSGHGAAPHETRDPVVTAARVILALQTIVSRELAPTTPAVVTVGSIHGGTKHNLIPDRVTMQLTVRSTSMEEREQILAAIRRIADGVARSADMPRSPEVKVRDEFTPALTNDPALTRRVEARFAELFGRDLMHERKPEMVGEDFARYGLVDPPIPIFMFRLGTVPKNRWEQSREPGGPPLPGLHSSQYAPQPEISIKAGVEAFVAAVRELLR